MARLGCLVVADPSREVAEAIAAETHRLASRRVVATRGEDALRAVVEHDPELLVLSLELHHPDAAQLVDRLRRSHPDLFIVATYRELSVPVMDDLGRRGVEDFVSQPIDYVLLFRAASERFGTPFRRHERNEASLSVRRADGVLVGTTRDISEGGLCMECVDPLPPAASLLIDIALPGDRGSVRARLAVLAVEGAAPGPLTARGQFHNLRGRDLERLRDFLADAGA